LTPLKTVSDGAKAAWDKAGDLANEAVDKAKEIGGEIEDKVKKTVNDVKDWWADREDSAKAMPPLPKVAIGAPQQERANKLLGQMSDDDKKKVQDVLDKASPDAKNYLTKALASKHSAAEIEDFSKKDRGQGPEMDGRAPASGRCGGWERDQAAMGRQLRPHDGAGDEGRNGSDVRLENA